MKTKAHNGNGTTDLHAERAARVRKPKEEPTPKELIEIPGLDLRIQKIKVVGDTSLIMNRFTAKAMASIKEKGSGLPSQPKAKRTPKQIFEDALYKLPNGKYYMPAGAFRGAAVSACTSLGRSVATKTGMRQAFQLVEDHVIINGGKPKMREDMGRNPSTGGGVVLIRGEFEKWWAEFHIRYNARVITPPQLINLINTSGFAVGIGEWRPEKNGNHGMFHVEL